MFQKIKKYIYAFIITSIISLVLYFIVSAIGWSRIETKLTSQGTIKSTIHEVQASGWDLRTVSWIDAHSLLHNFIHKRKRWSNRL